MKTDVLQALLLSRLHQHKSLDYEIAAEFIGTRAAAVRGWATKKHAPRGEFLNRLWHFLKAVGIHSPELDALPEYSRILGELHAYGVLKMVNNSDDPNRADAIIDILGLKNDRDAFEIMRGDRTPHNPKLKTVAELLEVYSLDLDSAKELWKEPLDKALPVKPKPKPTASAPANDTVSTDDPAVSDEAMRELKTSLESVTEALDVEAGLAAVLKRAEAEALQAEIPVQAQPERFAGMEVRVPEWPAAPPVDEKARGRVSPEEIEKRTFKAAELLAQLIPLVSLLHSDACTDEERARLRELLGQQTYSKLVNELYNMISIPAYRKNRGKS